MSGGGVVFPLGQSSKSGWNSASSCMFALFVLLERYPCFSVLETQKEMRRNLSKVSPVLESCHRNTWFYWRKFPQLKILDFQTLSVSVTIVTRRKRTMNQSSGYTDRNDSRSYPSPLYSSLKKMLLHFKGSFTFAEEFAALLNSDP